MYGRLRVGLGNLEDCFGWVLVGVLAYERKFGRNCRGMDTNFKASSLTKKQKQKHNKHA